MKKDHYHDKVIIITGASSGIGKELAYQLSAQGARLVLAARNVQRLADIADQCITLGGDIIAVPTDVTDKKQCEHLIERAISHYKQIDVLINNAGITMWSGFDQLKNTDGIEEIMKVNYFGAMYCTFYALPYLKKSKGQIVGISSLTGKTGVPTRSGYAASKHAMAGFFDSLRIELRESGVSVTMIYPSFVKTEMRERALGSDGEALGQSHLDESKVMNVETCARMILNASAKRKRELVMTAKGKVGLWLKLIAPSLVDSIALKTISRGK